MRFYGKLFRPFSKRFIGLALFTAVVEGCLTYILQKSEQ
jgi:hypothetical protein